MLTDFLDTHSVVYSCLEHLTWWFYTVLILFCTDIEHDHYLTDFLNIAWAKSNSNSTVLLQLWNALYTFCCNKCKWQQQLISWWPSQHMHLMAELNYNNDNICLFCRSDHLKFNLCEMQKENKWWRDGMDFQSKQLFNYQLREVGGPLKYIECINIVLIKSKGRHRNRKKMWNFPQ